MRQIKVLHVTTSLGGNGVANLLYNYYSNIDRTSIKFDFCAIECSAIQPFKSKFEQMGCHVYYMPKSYIKRVPFLYNLIRSNHYDIVHSHIELPSALYLLIALFAGVKVRIAHAHTSSRKSGVHNAILRFLLKIVSTHKMGCSQVAIVTQFGIDRKAIVLHNAINVDAYSYKQDIRDKYRADFDIQDKCVIGYVGRFTYVKNIFFLLDIFEEYHKRNDNSVLLMVGNGELEGEFKKEAANKNIAEYIIYTGNRYDVNNIMQAMDCLLLTSRSEGLGIVLIEAQTAALPAITCRETIPVKETNITPYIKYCSINDSPKKWADAIEGQLPLKRTDTTELIRQASYDILREASVLSEFYQNAL